MLSMTEVKRGVRPELSIVVDGQTGMRVSIRGSREKSQATGRGVWARLLQKSNVLLLATSRPDENWQALPRGGRSRENGACEIQVPSGLGSVAVRHCREVGLRIENTVLAGDLGVDCAFEPGSSAYAVTLEKVQVGGRAGFHMCNSTLNSKDVTFGSAARLIVH